MKQTLKVVMTAASLMFAASTYAGDGADLNGEVKDAQAELQETSTTLAEELGLNEEQIKKITALREEASKKLDAISFEAIGEDVIVNMIKSGQWDDAKAKQQLQAIGKTQAEIRYERAHYIYEVSKVLTAEQRTKLRELMLGEEMY